MVAANRADIAFAIQSAKGTPATASKYRTFLTGGRQPGISQSMEDFAETTGSRMISDAYVSQAHVEGSPAIYAMPKMAAALLTAVLGGRTTTGAGDPYTHTIIPASTLPYVTFWRWLADLIFERSSDCKVTQLVIHGESGKPITLTATVQGLSPVYKTSQETSVAVEVAQRFMHYDGAAALKVEGTAVAHIRSFDITINNNGQIIPGDSLTPYDVAETDLSVMVRTTQLVVDAATWKRIHYGSATPADLAVPSTTPVELAGSPAGVDFKWTRVAAAPGPERSMEILVPRLIAQPFDIEPAVGANPFVQEITYKAYQPASGASITAIVKNGISDAAF
ncbi:MAG: Phage tail tube protein [Chloroflexota bacterium]|jgi:hypothetical protein|nr:Phage tail tube protein [Chloroflexota bacterium]